MYERNICNKLTGENENLVIAAVHEVCITVDKEELEKALRYDRNQYGKGYIDGVLANRLKGIWLDDEGKKKENGYCGYCSVCGIMSEYLTDYCPHCGANMVGDLKGESHVNV